MKNTNINNNDNNKDDENKHKYLEAQRRAARAFHERNKDNEVNKQKQRETLKSISKRQKKL
jgi:hypothetical protein